MTFGTNTPVENRRDREDRVIADLRDIVSESDRLRRRFSELNHFSTNEFHALRFIMIGEKQERFLTAGDLRKQMGLSAAAITYLVGRMADAGHVRRDNDPTDGRRVILRCTENGVIVAARLRATLAAHSHRAFATLDDDDLEAAHRAFAALGVALRAYGSDLPEWTGEIASNRI